MGEGVGGGVEDGVDVGDVVDVGVGVGVGDEEGEGVGVGVDVGGSDEYNTKPEEDISWEA